MRLCVVGDTEDLSLAYLAWRARQRGADVVELREDEVGITWACRCTSPSSTWEVETQSETFTAEQMSGAIVRLNPEPAIPEELGLTGPAAIVYTLERRYGLYWWLERAPFPVANRPFSGRSNSSKPFQMMQLSARGFDVPRWIASNNPDSVGRFLKECPNGAVYKACSGLRARVRKADDTLLERLVDGAAPVLVQEYVEGVDVRVHVVGSRIFASEIVSTAIDYRYAEQANQYHATEIPEELTALCRQTTETEGLLVSGFDFRRTPEGQWRCFEVNPVPTFLPYEAGTAQPIADAILDCFGPLPQPAQEISPLAALSCSRSSAQCPSACSQP
jgi:hypothetical protein